MRVYAPLYYKHFKCMGGSCPRNCCIGWEIDVDAEALKRYESAGGELAERIRNSIDKSGDVSHFRLCDGERCPHLNEHNLCNIIAEWGEEGLCEICREHPRYYNEYGDLREVGVGLACPAAAKLILQNGVFAVEKIDDSNAENAPVDDTLLYVLNGLRREIYRLLSMPEHFGADRLIPFICDNTRYTVDFCVCDIDSDVYSRDDFTPDRFLFPSDPYDEVSADDMERTREVYLSLQLLDEGFRREIEATFDLVRFDTNHYKTDFEPAIYLRKAGAVYLRRLLYYFIHRYLLGGAVDGEYDIRARHAIICSYLAVSIGYLRGGKPEDILSAAVDLSRNIEYDEDNLDRVIYLLDRDGYLPPLWIGQLFE